jgi:hypothetical protein
MECTRHRIVRGETLLEAMFLQQARSVFDSALFLPIVVTSEMTLGGMRLTAKLDLVELWNEDFDETADEDEDVTLTSTPFARRVERVWNRAAAAMRQQWKGMIHVLAQNSAERGGN